MVLNTALVRTLLRDDAFLDARLRDRVASCEAPVETLRARVAERLLAELRRLNGCDTARL